MNATNTTIKVKVYEVPVAAPFTDSSDHNDMDKVDLILESPSHYSWRTPQFGSTRVLGTWSVVAITYMVASGGPIGSEPVIASAGPLIGILGFAVFPLLMTIPKAFIIAELCSAFPEDGGFTVWVMNAFGPFWGFFVGYLSWVVGIFSGALLPGVLVRLVCENYDVAAPTGAIGYSIKAAIAIALSLLTLVGARNVGRLCVVLCAFVILAFLVFTVWAYSVAVEFDDLLEIRREVTTYNTATKDVVLEGDIAIDWETFINTIFWNYDGVIMISVFGGQILNPARVYPRAIGFTVALMIAMYIIPIPASLSSDDIHWSLLSNDSYPLIAKDVGGLFLQALIVLAAMASTGGMFIASLYAKSVQLSGMAENALVPPFLARKTDVGDVPYNAVLLTLVLTLPLLSVEYTNLLPITNAFSAAVQLLVFAAAFSLRIKLPYIPRPTRVPGGKYMVLLFAVFPAAILSYILYHVFTLPFTTLEIAAGLFPGVVYGAWQSYRRRNATW